MAKKEKFEIEDGLPKAAEHVGREDVLVPVGSWLISMGLMSLGYKEVWFVPGAGVSGVYALKMYIGTVCGPNQAEDKRKFWYIFDRERDSD